jgi:hypothetical protein
LADGITAKCSLLFRCFSLFRAKQPSVVKWDTAGNGVSAAFVEICIVVTVSQKLRFVNFANATFGAAY